MNSLLLLLALLLVTPAAGAAEASYPDLPSPAQVNSALDRNVNVLTAETALKLEQSRQRQLDIGDHELSVRTSSGSRHVVNSGQSLPEWNISVERPVRIAGKAQLDDEIGAAGVARAQYAVGDARHEAARSLLHLWFNWQRAYVQAGQWQQQVDLLRQLEVMTEKRLRAGDIPQMEVNQAQAAVAQADASLQQAILRNELAATELRRQFPGLQLPPHPARDEPQAVTRDFDYWKQQILADNHLLGMAQAERRVQQLQAQRSRADRIPDPTIGLYHASEMGGNERVTYAFVSIPLAFGLRAEKAEGAGYRAEIAAEQEASTRLQLENEIYGTYIQATGSYAVWRQAHSAAASVRQNADLMVRAYSLGESGLPEVLTARRLALESALAETMAQFDANEARYRLLLDAHQLWPLEPQETAK